MPKYGVVSLQTNLEMFWCGNVLAVKATGDPLSSDHKRHGPGYGHAFKFNFEVASNHVDMWKKYQPLFNAEVVPWAYAEKLAKQEAMWWAGHEHPPVYVPGSRRLMAAMKREFAFRWMTLHLEVDGLRVLDIDQDIEFAEPAPP